MGMGSINGGAAAAAEPLVGTGGGCCRLSLDDGMPGNDIGMDGMPGSEALLLELPDVPSDEQDEWFLDCDTGDGVPSV